MVERDLAATVTFLTGALGFQKTGEEGSWQRYGLGRGKSGQYVDLRAMPEARRGAWGTGSVHHLAWRVGDEAHQLEVRESVAAGGAEPTPVIDRFWFKSVYFREPGGVLFELATDGPGFHVDEAMATLGETLVLPPWLEAERAAIEAVLPKLRQPALA
jgi:glyoxalase family protein